MHRSITVTKGITVDQAISTLEAHGYTITPPAHRLEIPIILAETVDDDVFLSLEGRVVGQIRNIATEES